MKPSALVTKCQQTETNKTVLFTFDNHVITVSWMCAIVFAYFRWLFSLSFLDCWHLQIKWTIIRRLKLICTSIQRSSFWRRQFWLFLVHALIVNGDTYRMNIHWCDFVVLEDAGWIVNSVAIEKAQKEEKWGDKKEETWVMAESIEPHSNNLPTKNISENSCQNVASLAKENLKRNYFICSAPRFSDLTFYFYCCGWSRFFRS